MFTPSYEEMFRLKRERGLRTAQVQLKDLGHDLDVYIGRGDYTAALQVLRMASLRINRAIVLEETKQQGVRNS